MRVRILWLFAFLIWSNAFATNEEFLRRLTNSQVLHWGEMDHNSGASIEAFHYKLFRKLTDVGFRRLIVEWKARDAAKISEVLHQKSVKPEDLGWIYLEDKRRSWATFLNEMILTNESLKEPWTVVPIDSYPGVIEDVKDRFKNRLETLTWCGTKLSDFSPLTLEKLLDGMAGTAMVRAAEDTTLFSNHPELLLGQKSVIYYGAGHGELRSWPGMTIDGMSSAFQGFHLRSVLGDKFTSVFPIPKDLPTKKVFEEFITAVQAYGIGPFYDSSRLREDVTSAYQSLFSPFEFTSKDCRNKFLKPKNRFDHFYDFVWIE